MIVILYNLWLALRCEYFYNCLWIWDQLNSLGCCKINWCSLLWLYICENNSSWSINITNLSSDRCPRVQRESIHYNSQDMQRGGYKSCTKKSYHMFTCPHNELAGLDTCFVLTQAFTITITHGCWVYSKWGLVTFLQCAV